MKGIGMKMHEARILPQRVSNRTKKAQGHGKEQRVATWKPVMRLQEHLQGNEAERDACSRPCITLCSKVDTGKPCQVPGHAVKRFNVVRFHEQKMRRILQFSR